jgi:hypothetical protein
MVLNNVWENFLTKLQLKVQLYLTFTSKIIKASIQTNDLEQNLSLPSKEGLSVNAQVSILYRLEREK